MGSYTFKWEHPAEEVFVTGTFDKWTKSVQLDKVDNVFQKTVDLKDASTKIYYKYVVDNNWTINETSPKEPDHEGNVNNFLTPADILKSDPSAAFISTVGPQSSTAKMAAEQPIEPAATPSEIPGGFPVTPSNELDQPIGVNPLPAAAGAINPISLKPGEKVPDATAQDMNANIRLDKESYEKSDALAGVDMQFPPGGKGTIPESGGLPMGTAATGATISTVGAGATTTALAGEVPLQAKVPEVVKESQDKAGVDPAASGVSEEVKDKAEVEQELKAKVPVAPTTSEGAAGFGTVKTEGMTGMAGTAASAATVAVAAAVAAKDTVWEKTAPAVNDATVGATQAADQNLPDSVKEKLPVSAQEALASQNAEQKREEVSPEVPAEVKESITEAGKEPEAAANTKAVEEKKAVEAELLKETKTIPADGETKGDAAKETVPQIKDAVKETVPQIKKDETPANGADTNPAAAETSADKKKKHRLSTFIKKLTGKEKK